MADRRTAVAAANRASMTDFILRHIEKRFTGHDFIKMKETWREEGEDDENLLQLSYKEFMAYQTECLNKYSNVDMLYYIGGYDVMDKSTMKSRTVDGIVFIPGELVNDLLHEPAFTFTYCS